MTYQIKAYGKLVHVDIMKIQDSTKILGKKPLEICILHLYYIAESHAADRPLPGEYCAKSDGDLGHILIFPGMLISPCL